MILDKYKKVLEEKRKTLTTSKVEHRIIIHGEIKKTHVTSHNTLIYPRKSYGYDEIKSEREQDDS